MRYFLSLLLWASALLITSASRAQDGAPDPSNFTAMTDFLPPAPNATAMVKYGQIALNKNTGAPNINIPLYTLKGRKLSTAIAIGYSSTGLKVDEIASRVGMGWSLLAGGVITRTVRGKPDEYNTRINPTGGVIGQDSASYHFLSNIASVSGNSGGFDSEPDLFNFNVGKYSGSFVFDNNMHVILVNAAPLQIRFNFTHPGVFTIVDPEGITYYFGGSSATDMTKKDQSCGKTFDTYVPTAWHLTRIQHPNGEVIYFNYTPIEYIYDNGISQTMYYTSQTVPSGGTLGSCASQQCSTPQGKTCISLLHTQGYLLDNILVPGICQATFTYVSRPDYQADKLVQGVTLTDLISSSTPTVGYWNFQYTQIQGNTNYLYQSAFGNNYTPYLVGLTEYSGDGTISKPYYFSYDDPAARCPRLSFSQDHWGYFNGANNTSMIPTPTDATLAAQFPLATANREANFAYTVKGMLSKIVYPTGGMDSIVYEANTMSSPLTFATLHQLNGTATGTGFSTTGTATYHFSIDAGQYPELDVRCVDNSGNGNFDPVHNKCQFNLYDPNGVEVSPPYPYVLTPGTSQTDHPWLVNPGNYTLTISANGSVATATVLMLFHPLHVGSGHYADQATGGLRVREVLTASPGQNPLIKRYYYGDINTLDVSSLNGFEVPTYNKIYYDRYFCQTGADGTAYNYLFCQHMAMYSSSQGRLYDFQNSPVSYVNVVESQGGDNFEKGGIETTFLSGSDAAGQVLWGDNLLDAPKSNFSSFLNGKVKEEFVFMQQQLPDGASIVPLTRRAYTYTIDSRIQPITSGFLVSQKYYNNVIPDWNCVPAAGNTCDILNYISAFDVTRYDVMSSWVYNNSVTESIYNGSTNNVMVNTQNHYYDDPTHLQLSRTQTYDSKGNLLTTQYRYPQDYAGQAVYDAMIARNIVSPIVDVEIDKGAGLSPLTETKINFSDWGNGNYQPASFQKSLTGRPFQNLGTINLLNAAGNVLEFTGADGITSSVIWGFNNTSPVAKIVGAGFNQAKAQLSIDTSQVNTLSGSSLLSQLDLIRQSLPAAQVTTYDYKPQVGVTTVSDLNAKPAYYDYDAFRRLVDVKDLDANIVKTIGYHMVTADSTVGITIYLSNPYSLAVSPSTCSPSYTSSPVTYYVPAGRYFSAISQADADAKAQADANKHAQDYANQNGTCTFTNDPV